MKLLRLVLPMTFAFAVASAPVFALTCTAPTGACSMDPTSSSTLRVESCGANGFDAVDDTNNWKAAIYCANLWFGDLLGTIEGTSGAKYIIKDTLSIETTIGGGIDGRGSRFEWQGTDATKPMFWLKSTTAFAIRDLNIDFSTTLHTAIRFTNWDPYYPSTKNIINHVYIGVDSTADLAYGVVWDFEGDYTCPPITFPVNNDLSTVSNTTIARVTEAAIKLKGQNSYGHLFENVIGYGKGDHANFIESDFGDYTANTVFAWGFKGAMFHIETNYEPIVIINSSAEECGRFIDSPAPEACNAVHGSQINGHGVEVIGGRFAVSPTNFNPDGHVVNWRRYANLKLSHLMIAGTLPTVMSQPELIYYDPIDTINFTANTNKSGLRLEGLILYLSNADATSWDPVYLGERGRISSSGNFCKGTGGGLWGNTECQGLLGGVTFNDVHALADLVAISTANSNFASGHSAFCSDCKPHTTPCQGSGSGTMAIRNGGAWDCGQVALAQTATSLASTPAGCSNMFARGISASGVAACASVGGTDFATQAANIVFAGPSSNGAATPSFRALVDDDIPDNITVNGATGRRRVDCQASGTASTAFVCTHSYTPSPTGTASNQPALSGAVRDYIQYASAATNNAVAGLNGGPFNLLRPAYRPKLVSWVRTDSAITTRRIWVAVSESSLAALAPPDPQTVNNSSTIDYAGLAYQDGVGGGNWLCCSGNGTNHSCIDTGVTVQASTEYALTVDWNASNSLTCRVMPQGGSITTTTKSTLLSTNSVDFGPYNALTTLSATARNHQIAFFTVEQN